ncbi:hypothetical protein C1280_07755 [Gemmata obscuriglobus]|uniref:Uncharacterized protein n=1 Tax=Gemmata obscuriglobus TaxID=114 RepID=A0A2Z3H5M2_9BACT|nr:hypothetical protein C1280_07755 [Gemmata obscuriglobus]
MRLSYFSWPLAFLVAGLLALVMWKRLGASVEAVVLVSLVPIVVVANVRQYCIEERVQEWLDHYRHKSNLS